MKMKVVVFILIIIICVREEVVVSLNVKLSDLEEEILYSKLKKSEELKLFYEKLIHSNGVEDLKDIQQSQTFKDQCFESSDDLLDVFQIVRNGSLNEKDVKRISPVLVDVKLNDGCYKVKGTKKWKNLLVGLISVTIINLTSLFGAIILPFRNNSSFKWILSTFIGLAVGTLIGTGIFHLIPMSFNVEDFDKEHRFLFKGLLTILVIYFFYMRDQLSKAFFHIQTTISTHNHGDEDLSPILKEKNEKSLRENLGTMKPIGWMILISDLLHGFIDGLTIGAIAMISINECLRMMIPIACEEFSHKLGDTAILLNSGLPIKQALLMNFLSACGCFPGFLLGAKLGEMENFHPWICALAGGMFVYIGLTDMIPELISMGEEIEKDYLKDNRPISKILKVKILLSQNLGVVFGIGVMFLLAKYGERLSQYF